MSCCGKQTLTICEAYLCEQIFLVGVLDDGTSATLYPVVEGAYTFTFSNGMEYVSNFTLDVLPLEPLFIYVCNLLPNQCYTMTIKVDNGYEYPYCIKFTPKIKKILEEECC